MFAYSVASNHITQHRMNYHQKIHHVQDFEVQKYVWDVFV